MRNLKDLKQKGLTTHGCFGARIAKPVWFDVIKFNRGQKFFKDNIISVFLSHLFSIAVVLSVPRILLALMYTNNSSTPKSALVRYISTIRIIMHWYVGNLWDGESDSQKSLLYTIKIHKAVAKSLNANDSSKLAKREIYKESE